jgi:hypothetical protein
MRRLNIAARLSGVRSLYAAAAKADPANLAAGLGKQPRSFIPTQAAAYSRDSGIAKHYAGGLCQALEKEIFRRRSVATRSGVPRVKPSHLNPPMLDSTLL